MEKNFEKLKFNLCDSESSLDHVTDPDTFFDDLKLDTKYFTIKEAESHLSQCNLLELQYPYL